MSAQDINPSGIVPTIVVAALVLAFPVSVLITRLVMARLRSAMGKVMASSSGFDDSTAFEMGPLGEGNSPVSLQRLSPADVTVDEGVRTVVQTAQRRARALAWRSLAAATVYSVVFASFWILPSIRGVFADESVAVGVKQGAWISFAFLSMVLINATPAVIAARLVLSRRSIQLLPGVVLLVAVLAGMQYWVGGLSLELWLYLAAVPTVCFLVLNTRPLRAVGPITFAAVMLVAAGVVAGVIAMLAYVWRVIGPAYFVREDLAVLPFLEAFDRYFAEVMQRDLAGQAAALVAFLDDPLSVIAVRAPEAATRLVEVQAYVIVLTCFAIGILAGWLSTRWLAWRHRTGRAGERSLSIDVMMVLFALPLMMLLAAAGESLHLVAGGALGLAGYFVVAHGRPPVRHGAAPGEAPSLLLLRVFNQPTQSQDLIEALEDRWRFIGPMFLVGGPDLAPTIIEPDEFYAYLSGKLSEKFVKDSGDIERALDRSSESLNPDGTWRVLDFFCHADTWQPTVARAARSATVVFMDVRGFDQSNRGCILELQYLASAVSFERIVLLADQRTDFDCLQATLDGAVGASTHRTDTSIRVLEATGRDSATVAALLVLFAATPLTDRDPSTMTGHSVFGKALNSERPNMQRNKE
jgi:hypothetical protein